MPPFLLRRILRHDELYSTIRRLSTEKFSAFGTFSAGTALPAGGFSPIGKKPAIFRSAALPGVCFLPRIIPLRNNPQIKI
jgi:hypothetical protein